MPPVTPSAISILGLLHVFRFDLLDLLLFDFLHRQPGELLRPFRLGRASAQQLLGPRPRHHHELELVHTVSFRTNDDLMVSIFDVIAPSRARSARTMARRRSTQASSSSLTMT